MDDDEIEFLDGILESSRAEEERVRKETQDGLDQFRQEQQKQEKIQEELLGEAADETGLVNDDSLRGEGWHVGGAAGNRKRKRREDKTARLGVKRKPSASDPKEPKEPKETAKAPEADSPSRPEKSQAASTEKTKPAAEEQPAEPTEPIKPATPAKPAKPAKQKLALVDYGSDGEDSE